MNINRIWLGNIVNDTWIMCKQYWMSYNQTQVLWGYVNVSNNSSHFIALGKSSNLYIISISITGTAKTLVWGTFKTCMKQNFICIDSQNMTMDGVKSHLSVYLHYANTCICCKNGCELTHLPLVPRIYASVNWLSTDSGNALLLVWHQAINWTNAGLLPIGLLGTNFIEIRIRIL